MHPILKEKEYRIATNDKNPTVGLLKSLQAYTQASKP